MSISSPHIPPDIAIVTASLNPGTASPSGDPIPTVAATVVEVVVIGGLEGAVVASVETVAGMDVAAASGAAGAGERSNHPSMNAAAATAATRTQRLGPTRGGEGRNSGSILT
jgi:hypothetical protein